MKKLITFLLVSFLVTTRVWAVTTQVSTAAQFNTAWGDANCDVIEMAAGTYTISASKSITRTITVKASASAVTKPIIVGAQFTMGGSYSIYFDGIEAYYDAEGAATPTGAYFLQVTGGVYTIPTISFSNCKIHGYGRSLIRADNTTNYPTINTLTVDNCFVYDMGRNSAGYSVFALKAARITTANITNSTFYSCMSGLWYEEVTGTAKTFNLEKCTLYKVSSSGSQLLIYNNGGADPSSYTIKDCIISDSYDNTTAKMQIKFGSNNGTIKGYLLNSVLANNFATPKFTNSTLTTNTEVVTTGITFTCNSPYTDLRVTTTPNSIIGIGDPRWSLNPVVVLPQETLYTSVNITGAGTVLKNPNFPTYDQNSTVDITASKNFGYAFVNWVDSVSGSVLSTANPYTVTMDGTKHIKAVFAALNTYKLTVNLVGGAKNYMVSASPAATVVDGNNMYEDGTVVTLTANSNPLLTFSNWSDNSTNLTLQFTMNQDQSTTATYSAVDYLVGWDFYRTGSSNRVAEFYSTSDNSTSTLIIRTAAGTTSSWLDKSVAAGSYYNRGAAVNWRPFDNVTPSNNISNGYYYQTSFVATDFTDIKVSAGLLYNYNAYSKQKCEYSLDGNTFTTVDTYTMSVAQTWYDKTINLPAECNHAARVYVRWIPDYTSSIIGAASGNDGTAISAIYITGTQAAFNDGLAPTLSSSVPVSDGTGASATGKVVLNFSKNVQVAGGTTATLGSKSLTPAVSGKSISFSYSGLNYNTSYTFTLAAGTVSDIFSNTLSSPVTFSFTTMNRPTVTKKSFDFVVGVDGNFSAAIAAATAASSSGNRFRIFFPNGQYNIGTTTGDANQMTTFTLPNVSFVGQSSDATVLYNQNTTEGIGNTATMYFTNTTNNLYLQDLSLKNNDYRSGSASLGRCVALWDQGTKNIYKNVNLLSNQDTYFSGTGRTYFEGGSIHGTVDFICGGGDVFFNETLLYLESRTGNCITAPSTTTSNGYVFSGCTIDGFANTNGNFYLGRPWQNSPRSVYINTKMNVLPTAAGWTEMGVVPTLFAEYNSTNSLGAAVDVSLRKSSYTYGGITTPVSPQVLTAEQAATYTIDNVLGGSDTWQPQQSTDQAGAPVIAGLNRTINWDDNNYVSCWGIFKNGTFIQFVTTNSYTIPNEVPEGAVYTVRAANEMGGLSEVSNTFTLLLTTSETNNFRSKVSGNSSDLTSWESSADNSNWFTATSLPTATATSVTVSNGHTITVNSNLSLSNLILNTGSVVDVNATNNLSVSTALTNNGTLNLLSDATGTATILTPSTMSGNGVSNVQQYLATTRNWYVSSPVSNAKAPTGFTYYQRNDAGTSWITQPFVAGNTFAPGKGYIALPVNTLSTLTFTTETGGHLNTGNIPVNLSSVGFNLIGNPYPAHLTWTKAFTDANETLIEPTIWVRTNAGIVNNSHQWSYLTYNSYTGLAVPNTTALSGGVIPPMQAFWVKSKGTGTLTLNSDLTKSHQASNPLKAPAPKNIERQILRLQVDNGTITDETLLYFDVSASNEYDCYDSQKFDEANTVTQIFTSLGNKKLVINGMNNLPLDTPIGMGFIAGDATSFSIKANEISNLPTDVKVILKDNANNVETDLTDGETVYEFTTATTPGDRFSLIFRSSNTGNELVEIDNQNIVVYADDNDHIVVCIPSINKNTVISVFNSIGQKVYSNIATKSTYVIHNSFTPGIYIVNVNSVSKKLIIK